MDSHAVPNGEQTGALGPVAARGSDRFLRVLELGRVEYGRALALQESIWEARVAGGAADYLLLLEHEPVYTLGRGADEADLLGAPQRLGVPVFRVGRGGGVTFHGPGQLVAYPLLRLARGGRDVQRYVRGLEQVLIRTCAAFGVEACARPGLTGVWVGPEKIASIGIGVRRWVTCHGVALNVSTDLEYFRQIVPCGSPQLPMTTLEKQAGRPISVADVASSLAGCFLEQMGYGSTRDGEVAF